MTVTLPFSEAADALALLVRATLLMGAAWAAAAALRKIGAPAAARHLAWLFGIAALLVLPVLWWLVPALSLPILPAADAAATSVPGAPPPFGSAGTVAPGLPVPETSLLLAMVYALGAALLLLRLFIGRRMLARLWSQAGAAPDPRWEDLLSRLSSEMLLSRRVELRIARGPAVPMTWGTVAPKVLLPAEAWEWPLERRRLVLLHELAHVARHDSFSRSLASLACALYWFHPGAWLAARQLRIEQEHAADDRVLMAGGSPKAYALSLLHLARGSGARPRFDQAAAMAGMYQLERRLVSITSPSRRNRPGGFFLSSSALLAASTTWIVAAGVPVSATPALPGPLPARTSDLVRSADDSADSRPIEEPALRPMPSEEVSSQPRDTEPQLEGSGPRPARIAGAEPVRPGEAARSRIEPADPGEESRDARPQAASSDQLRNYGWELRRSGFEAPIDSPAQSSRPIRLALPERESREPKDRIRLPKWARNAPQLVRGRPPTGSHPSAQGPLVLSWSLEVVGK